MDSKMTDSVVFIKEPLLIPTTIVDPKTLMYIRNGKTICKDALGKNLILSNYLHLIYYKHQNLFLEYYILLV